MKSLLALTILIASLNTYAQQIYCDESIVEMVATYHSMFYYCPGKSKVDDVQFLSSKAGADYEVFEKWKVKASSKCGSGSNTYSVTTRSSAYGCAFVRITEIK